MCVGSTENKLFEKCLYPSTSMNCGETMNAIVKPAAIINVTEHRNHFICLRQKCLMSCNRSIETAPRSNSELNISISLVLYHSSNNSQAFWMLFL